ncbi:MAG: CAP domain-containing protein [Planctomycetota bacterium]|nr:CAP domain-containing protein [Planctomycetota bacterium]
MKRTWITAVLALVFAVVVPAQSAEEIRFRQGQAKKLVDLGSRALKKGFPNKAKIIFMMVLNLYDEDNADAHKALGQKKSGTAWLDDPNFKYPRVDKPSPAAASALLKDTAKTFKQLVDGHSRMAKKYLKAGQTPRAQNHYRMILRFAPDNEEARKNLELVQVADGLSGTSTEQEIYKRGLHIADAVKLEGSKDYVVEKLPDTNRNAILDGANVEYISVKSEHFILRGDYEEAILKEAALWAERALRVAQAAFSGYDDMFFSDVAQWPIKEFSFFQSKDTYKQIILAHQSKIGNKEQVEFLLEYTSGTTLGNIGVSATNSKKGALDGAVRRVARMYSSMGPAALSEGIGHTFVGLLLRNNRAFLVDRKKQIGTQTDEDDIAKFSPDMDMWEELAVEQAWSKTTLPAIRLPLITADKFDDNMRIKSWSFCHYLMLRDPALLRHLSRTGRLKDVVAIEKDFTKKAGVSLAQLDKEWKDFFTGATPVMRAIRKREDPMLSVSKDVKKWLTAFNKVRTKTFHSAPVNWSARFSTRCRHHADYLANNKLAGPEQEQRQDPQLPGSTHEGNMFAQMAMVSSNARNPKAVIEGWMNYPGYRDLFFVNTLKTIGIYSDKKTLVLNVVQGLIVPRTGNFYLYPKHAMTKVPVSIKVADLGPEMLKILKQHGHEGLKEVGFPISLHFGNSGRMGERKSYRCKVIANGRDGIEGFIHIADDGSHRRTSSPGLVVFYPLKPIRKGSTVKVSWSFKRGKRIETVDATYYH